MERMKQFLMKEEGLSPENAECAVSLIEVIAKSFKNGLKEERENNLRPRLEMFGSKESVEKFMRIGRDFAEKKGWI